MTAGAGRAMLLTIVRHGETVANTQGILQGQTDTPLNDTGILQAELVGQAVASKYALDVIYTSDLQRASHTAQAILRRIPDCKLMEDRRLREKACGVVEGLPYGTTEKLARAAGVPYDQYVPEGAEPVPEFRSRISHFMSEIYKKHAKPHEHNDHVSSENDGYLGYQNGNIPNVAIVTHGGVIYSMLMEFGARPSIPGNASVSQFLLSDKKGGKAGFKAHCLIYDDGAHLHVARGNAASVAATVSAFDRV